MPSQGRIEVIWVCWDLKHSQTYDEVDQQLLKAGPSLLVEEMAEI
jgi:hypothetical protein